MEYVSTSSPHPPRTKGNTRQWWIVGFFHWDPLFSWNFMLIIGDYYYNLFPVSRLKICKKLKQV
ncbi:Hypothetical predicted protein [Olea europaea subsp. europaea]|uniref:Uncharacterized protein n=1 Tax=Olea europaea subsp. europaea TaxID=158383 RepID=A0A8S0UD56_OLEEU|nr:Hypothetical predicted protein [Olea europaea subsp. europaea]